MIVNGCFVRIERGQIAQPGTRPHYNEKPAIRLPLHDKSAHDHHPFRTFRNVKNFSRITQNYHSRREGLPCAPGTPGTEREFAKTPLGTHYRRFQPNNAGRVQHNYTYRTLIDYTHIAWQPLLLRLSRNPCVVLRCSTTLIGVVKALEKRCAVL